MTEKTLTTIQHAMAQQHGPLGRLVLDFLAVMERIVNNDKQTKVTPEDWAPLGVFMDTEKFFRVGNYGEKVHWPEYSTLDRKSVV